MSSRGQAYLLERSGSLALVEHSSSVAVTIKIPYEVDVLLHWPAYQPILSYGLVKTESDFIMRLVDTGLGRWTLIVMRLNKEVVPTGFSLNRTKYQVSFIVMHGSVSQQLFLVVWIFLRSLSVICYSRLVISEDHKSYFGLTSH